MTMPASDVRAQLSATERLVEVAQELSLARNLETIMRITRHAARALTQADGATFVLRDGDHCFYADEEAISPLWKGHRFPMTSCISGWSMLNKQSAVIEDIYADERVPQDAYQPTFVKSLAMVPIRTTDPVGAIGNYWAVRHRATDGEVKLLRALADLTSVAMENVQLYGELQKRMSEAQQAVQTKDEFITVAAHELRTPLTALQLQLQSLEKLAAGAQDSIDRRFSERTSRALNGARRLGALVDGLVDATQGEIALTLEEFDLAEAARAVADRFASSARRAGCDVDIKATTARGRWDRQRIEQVLTHLLSNAFKYGPQKPVEIIVERRGESGHLEVRDQGAGIAPEIAGKIFERFGRAGSISHYGGLGLGLYLTRQVVEAHGGTIRFDSKANEGCTFVIDLPSSPPGKA